MITKQKFFFIIVLFPFLTFNCKSQSKEESRSLEDCYQENVKQSRLMTGWYYISDVDSGFTRQLDKTNDFYKINPFPIATAEDMVKLSINTDNRDNLYLSIKFGERGTDSWSVATKRSIGKQLALIVDDKLLCTPLVNMQITGGNAALGRTNYTKEDLEKVKQAIENNKTAIGK